MEDLNKPLDFHSQNIDNFEDEREPKEGADSEEDQDDETLAGGTMAGGYI